MDPQRKGAVTMAPLEGRGRTAADLSTSGASVESRSQLYAHRGPTVRELGATGATCDDAPFDPAEKRHVMKTDRSVLGATSSP